MIDVKKIAITVSFILTWVLIFIIQNPKILLKEASSEFRNLSFNGKVVHKFRNEEKKEKTHKIVLSDSAKYQLPRVDIDKDIEIGDSIIKVKQEYEITIYKKANPNNKIIYALPFTE